MSPWRLRVTFTTRSGPREWLSPDLRRERPGWGDAVFSSLIEIVELIPDFPPDGAHPAWSPLEGGRGVFGSRLVLSGMESYNFFIEGLAVIGSNGLIPQAFHLLGKLPASDPSAQAGMITMWTIVPGTSPIHEYKPWGREYHGTPTSGWKPGAVGRPVISRLVSSASFAPLR